MKNEKVLIVIGSASDRSVMEETSKVLDEFGVPYEVVVASAHRTPQKVEQLARGARGAGVRLIVGAAGFAAHLAGTIAAHTTLPVIGVPLPSSSLGGMDALLSTVQMPSGVPVATMAIGKTGARNAGIFAVQILSLTDEILAEKLARYREGVNEA